MSTTRLLQVWLGILGIAVGVAVMFSGVLTSEPVQASNDGIKITVVRSATDVK